MRTTVIVLIILTLFFKQSTVTATAFGDSIAYSDKIIQGVLKNGLKYYVLKSAVPKNVVYLSLVCRVGYDNENSEERGVAHLIEHLGLRSTASFPSGMRTAFSQLGLTIGDYSASTGRATTNYRLIVRSDDHHMVKIAMSALRDWTHGHSLIASEIDEEKSAVINEILRSNTKTFAGEMQERYLILNHDPRTAFRPLAEIENIKQVTPNTIRKFYEKWYRPDLQALIVVGDINEREIETTIKRLFSSVKAPKDKITELKPEVVNISLTGDTRLFAVGHGTEDNRIHVKLFRKRNSKIDFDCRNKRNEIKIRLTDRLFSEMINSRIDHMRRDKGLTTRISVGIERQLFFQQSGLDAMAIRYSADDFSQAKTAMGWIIAEVFRVEKWGFTMEEFLKARYTVKLNLTDKALRTRSNWLNNKLIASYMENCIFGIDDVAIELDLLNEMSLQDVHNLATDWIKEWKDVDVIFSTPDNITPSDIPSEGDVTLWMQEFIDAPVLPYQNRRALNLEVFSPKGYITHSYIENLSAIEATKVVLGNGATIILKSLGKIDNADDRTNEISLRAFKPGGANLVKGPDYLSAKYAAKIVSSFGVANLNKEELTEWLADKNRSGYLTVAPYVSDTQIGIVGASNFSQYEDLLNLVYLYFTKPRIDTLEYDRWLTKNRSRFARRDKANMFEDSVQAFITSSEIVPELRRADLESAILFYQQQFSNVSGFTFVICGYFDKDSLLNQTERIIGSLPSASLYPIQDPSSTAPANKQKLEGPLTVTIPGDSSATTKVRMVFGCESVSTEDQLMRLNVFNETLQLALYKRLREVEGAVYAVQSSLRRGSSYGQYSIVIAFDAKVGDVDMLTTVTIEEANALLLAQAPSEIFKSALSNARDKILFDGRDSGFWASYIVEALLRGKPLITVRRRLEILSQLTQADISNTASSVIDFKNYAVFKTH